MIVLCDVALWCFSITPKCTKYIHSIDCTVVDSSRVSIGFWRCDGVLPLGVNLRRQICTPSSNLYLAKHLCTVLAQLKFAFHILYLQICTPSSNLYLAKHLCTVLAQLKFEPRTLYLLFNWNLYLGKMLILYLLSWNAFETCVPAKCIVSLIVLAQLRFVPHTLYTLNQYEHKTVTLYFMLWLNEIPVPQLSENRREST